MNIRFLLALLAPLVFFSGCNLGTEANRFQVYMAQERPTILLDAKNGKTWVNTACPENPSDYGCWQQMKYDQQPDASK